MKFMLIALWSAAGLAAASAGATFAEVHFEHRVATQLQEIHGRLAAARHSTVTMNQQLTLLSRINRHSSSLLSQLHETVTVSSAIASRLGTLSGTVNDLNRRVSEISSHTIKAASELKSGVSPAQRVNQLLGQVGSTNQSVAQDLRVMLSLDQQLNQVLQETNNKIP